MVDSKLYTVQELCTILVHMLRRRSRTWIAENRWFSKFPWKKVQKWRQGPHKGDSNQAPHCRAKSNESNTI